MEEKNVVPLKINTYILKSYSYNYYLMCLFTAFVKFNGIVM